MTQQTLTNIGIEKTATFSPCRRYRYDLIRQWDKDKGTCLFICLNPSTADETTDDPTVRRCINYASDWGYGTFVMCNLFALRATDPDEMKNHAHPISEPLNPARNDETIHYWAQRAKIVICAWGTHGNHRNRADQWIRQKQIGGFKTNIPELHCLKTTKDGHPAHPLYLPKKLKPKPWSSTR